jgi:hypothetical protein
MKVALLAAAPWLVLGCNKHAPATPEDAGAAFANAAAWLRARRQGTRRHVAR